MTYIYIQIKIQKTLKKIQNKKHVSKLRQGFINKLYIFRYDWRYLHRLLLHLSPHWRWNESDIVYYPISKVPKYALMTFKWKYSCCFPISEIVLFRDLLKLYNVNKIYKDFLTNYCKRFYVCYLWTFDWINPF